MKREDIKGFTFYLMDRRVCWEVPGRGWLSVRPLSFCSSSSLQQLVLWKGNKYSEKCDKNKKKGDLGRMRENGVNKSVRHVMKSTTV